MAMEPVTKGDFMSLGPFYGACSRRHRSAPLREGREAGSKGLAGAFGDLGAGRESLLCYARSYHGMFELVNGDVSSRFVARHAALRLLPFSCRGPLFLFVKGL